MNATPMSRDEGSLLQRFVRNGDPDAFSQIIHLYSGLVYGTCLRITRNEEYAADASQQTFYHLLKNAGRITGSLGGWLHRVAVRRAIDLVRREASRRHQESAFAQIAVEKETDEWSEVAPLLDEAVRELDEDLRDVIIQYYLQGQSMAQIAAARGVSQPTVSRRITQALDELRAKFKSKGVLLSAAVLLGLMPNAASSMPATVLQGLGKMVLAASISAPASMSLLSGMNLKMLALGLMVGLSGGLGWILVNRIKDPSSGWPSASQVMPVRNFTIPPRDSKAPDKLINLTAYYNAPLSRSWHEPDGPPNDLAELPTGMQMFAGTAFDVRGIVQVSRDMSLKEYPAAVRGIRIGQRCRRLDFLHAAIRASTIADGTEIGRYLVYYANGEFREILIVIGQDVADWWEQPGEEGKPLVIAWTGQNPKSRSFGKKIRLFKSTWENPLPKIPIRTVDFLALKAEPSPFLVALTVE